MYLFYISEYSCDSPNHSIDGVSSSIHLSGAQVTAVFDILVHLLHDAICLHCKLIETIKTTISRSLQPDCRIVFLSH